MTSDRIEREVASYFSGKIGAHGATPQGVDWNSDEAQVVRFEQLMRLAEPGAAYSLNDYGCGYAALYDFLRARGDRVDYRGYDVAESMVEAAAAAHANAPDFSVTADLEALREADFTVASGIFNIRVGASDEEWWDYIVRTLETFDRLSRRGFAFNALTSYSDAERMRPDLYYADPLRLFDHCKRHFSRNVALLHDYEIWDFTLLVRL